MTAALSPAELVGLLAVSDRLRVVAAVTLGARTVVEIQRSADLDARAATRALQRLVDAGLVVRSDNGEHWLVEEAFRIAARSAAAKSESRDVRAPGATPAEIAIAKVMRAFVRDGRLISIPAAPAKRRVILDWLSQRFEPGQRYRETMVNVILGQVHPDTAALRRYLVDEGLMTRENGEYWRSGGPVET